MCGLFASIGFAPDRRLLDLVAHRGPDGSGWHVTSSPAGPVALGHRRLAIIDTSDAGLQPIADTSGRYWLLLNGEIYNYRELRRELESEGFTFRSSSDSEVLLYALIRWGEAALDRCLGMFAIIFWDDVAKTMLLVRDRFGIKPLYYLHDAAGRLALGSEIKQLLPLMQDDTKPNLPRLGEFLVSAISDHTDETMFAGVRQVLPGELIRVALSDRCQLSPRQWYVPQAADGAPRHPREAAEAFRTLLDDAIRLHLRADVTVGSCLSGGLDSSSIVSIVAQMLSGTPEQDNFATITASYPGSSVDEGDFARAVAAHSGQNAVFFTPDPREISGHIDDIVGLQDEPFGSTSILSQWAVFREAKQHGIKVMLDGQGADEQLAGYHWMFGMRYAELFHAARLPTLAATWRDQMQHDNASLPRNIAAMALALLPESVKNALRSFDDRRLGISVLKTRQEKSGMAMVAGHLGITSPRTVNALCSLQVRAANLPMLLHWEDRNSMAHGVEARVPFLDHRLVELSLGLPSDCKFDLGLTKRVLRDAMGATLPDTVRLRRSKLGFATPEADWLGGALNDALREGLMICADRFPALVSGGKLRELAQGRSPTGKTDLLWRLANTGLWARHFGLAQ